MSDLAPDYAAFLAAKAPRAAAIGIEPGSLPGHLFDFQAHVVAFLLRQGRGAAFLDTGLGKTAIELEWCRQAAEASNGQALLLTPLAVAKQIETEGRRWGYEVRVIRSQGEAGAGINICNYDRLDRLRPEAFGAVSLDESSIIKSFTGATARALIEGFAGTRFRLSATATPAPNDHMELGQQSEFLGVMSSSEMLMRWFISDQTKMGCYRLKRYGEATFWDWMTSWSRCAETPADLGYDASRFVLPELQVIRHKACGDVRAPAGALFVTDMSATNIHDIKRQTAGVRARVIANLVTAEPGESWLIWTDTNYESSVLAKLLPNATEIHGSQSIEQKEGGLAAFVDGSARILITKPTICGFGMNFQHCARMGFVGRSFSYQAWYQAVRRCWRFGQTRPVQVHLAVAEGEDQIGRTIDHKASEHQSMKRAMAAAMRRDRGAASALRVAYDPQHIGRLPPWLKTEA